MADYAISFSSDALAGALLSPLESGSVAATLASALAASLASRQADAATANRANLCTEFGLIT